MAYYHPLTNPVANPSGSVALTPEHASRQAKYVWGIAAATALLHLAVAGRYGFFRNELYFIACGRRPDFGYVDQPPLIPLIAAATQVFGIHLWLLRLPAVVAAAALVPVTAAFARLFSRQTVVVVSAAIAAAISPSLAALTSTLTTATFEPLAWTSCAYFVARFLIRRDRYSLLWAGVVTGMAMEAKYGIAMWLAGLCAGLLLFRWKVLASKQFLYGAIAAIGLAIPSLIWQSVHGWPFLALIAYHRATGFALTGTPAVFEITQIRANNLLLAPLWIGGIIAPFFTEHLKSARFLAVAFLAATVIDFVSGGKDYYLFGAYPTMFAVGAGMLSTIRPRWLVVAWLASAAGLFAIALPLALPVLDPPKLERYIARTHLRPRPEETAAIGAPLTQVFSDEMGWRELEKQVASIYDSLPPGDRQKAAIFASNYGEAAAIDVFGREDRLPFAISGGNQYFLWGPRGATGSVMIIINGHPRRWAAACGDLQIVGTFGVPYAMPYERDRPIMVCHGLRRNLQSLWPRLQRYE